MKLINAMTQKKFEALRHGVLALKKDVVWS